MEILIFIAVVVAIAILLSRSQARQLKAAAAAYRAALDELAANPADNRLRIAALEAGRHYADLARRAAGSKGRAIFDEVALSNDLSARSGAAPAPGGKPCPQCAELVKPDARICRFCQFRLESAA